MTESEVVKIQEELKIPSCDRKYTHAQRQDVWYRGKDRAIRGAYWTDGLAQEMSFKTLRDTHLKR